MITTSLLWYLTCADITLVEGGRRGSTEQNVQLVLVLGESSCRPGRCLPHLAALVQQPDFLQLQATLLRSSPHTFGRQLVRQSIEHLRQKH